MAFELNLKLRDCSSFVNTKLFFLSTILVLYFSPSMNTVCVLLSNCNFIVKIEYVYWIRYCVVAHNHKYNLNEHRNEVNVKYCTPNELFDEKQMYVHTFSG